MASALLDDAVNGRQPQSGSFARSLRGEERLENVGLRRMIHAGAVIADRQHHIAPRLDLRVQLCIIGVEFDVASFDGQLSALWHGVTSIDGQVYDDLLDLPGVGFHLSQRRGKHRRQADVLTYQTPQHLLRVGHEGVEVKHPAFDNIFATECQELTGKMSGPFASLVNLLNHASQWVVRLQAGYQYFTVT